MMKHLLIGASALVLTTVAAQAQVDPRAKSTAVAVDIKNNGSVPIEGNEIAPYANALKSATSKGAATSARSGAQGAFDLPNGVASYYNNAMVSAASDVQSVGANGNKSAIDTDGDNNEAIVDQTGGYKGWAAIRQDGDINQAKIDQDDLKTGTTSLNAASIQQISPGTSSGTAFTQKAVINQVQTTGTLQNAAILQGGLNYSGGFSGSGGFANNARIDQRGGSNSTLSNDASIVQAGSEDTGYIEQGSVSGGQTVGSRASIQQLIRDNAGIYQTGQTNSRAYVYQSNGITKADVIQSGSNGNNFAAVNQDVNDAYSEVTTFVSQTGGSGNSAFVNQSAVLDEGYAEVFQNGSNNVALLTQAASPIAHGQISQTGTGNYAATYQ